MNAAKRYSKREQAKRNVLDLYARKKNYGKHKGRPEVCTPSPVKPHDGGPRGPRVIFADRESAEAAAELLSQIYLVTYRVYTCPRSRRGHCHLTDETSYQAAGGAAP